jgi:RIO-like serine/threonine protein kinase
VINGLDVPSAKDLIIRSESFLINNSQFGRFHGDFILDNILVVNDSFTLIDWRQDFAESLEFGDIYYDLSKLNHSLHINHSLVFEGQFFISTKQNETQCGILRKDVHVEMEKHLKSFIENKNLSWKKIQIITALIWINMAPLHHHPFDKFLYYYGRYHLWRALIA